ncbi:MAG: response regulator [Cyclobacteriaceae bacterium]|jgi:two-component system response regulator NreC|nr:response regulator transcription factor [Flammeovirgaceae bacterium]
MQKIRLAVVDDHEKFRKAITRLIHFESDMEVVLQAENGEHLLELLKIKAVDLILMDIRMPKMDGFMASEKVKKLYPNIKIIAFSQYDLEANIIEMNIRGVKSFVGKEDEPRELFKAIRTVINGGVYMTDRSAEIVQRYLLNISKIHNQSTVDLCEKEKTLLKMLVQGLTSRQIGEKLSKSHRTIDDMRNQLYLKFNVNCKEQLIALATKWNLA